MKILHLLLFGLVSLPAQELTLTEADRQALLEKLEEVRQEGTERASIREGDALTAFRNAVSSDKSSFALWIKCAEKVLFLDEKRDGQAFREWKRGQGDRLDSEPFHRALRHQLSWLLLAMEAGRPAVDDKSANEISAKAVARIDAILADAKVLKERVVSVNNARNTIPAFAVIEEDVFKTEFAQAFPVSAPTGWPTSPLKIREVYEMVVLKPYFEMKDYESYRSAWMKMIAQIAEFTEMKGREADTGGKSADFEKFVSDSRPQLRWELEKKIFEMGDQRTAAKNMIALLDEYSGHEDELLWASELQQLLDS